MMKEYLCSNFLADQILNEVAPAHFQSRLGYAAAETSTRSYTEKFRTFHSRFLFLFSGNSTNATDSNRKTSRSLKANDIQESMRFDQGSTGYKDWLTK